MEENGTLVAYDGLLSLAEESNRKYDKPETIKPPSELSLSRERHWVPPMSCGLARPRSLAGEKPTQVAVSHGP
jgi:hypothetical protein